MLSSKKVLDEIDNRVSATVKKADITHLPEGINHTGEGKQYRELLKQSKELEEAIQQASFYDSAGLVELKQAEEAWETTLERLRLAKRHKAYSLSVRLNP